MTERSSLSAADNAESAAWLRITRGNPAAEEIAAVVAVLRGREAAERAAAERSGSASLSGRGGWADRASQHRTPLPDRAPDAWRRSALSR